MHAALPMGYRLIKAEDWSVRVELGGNMANRLNEVSTTGRVAATIFTSETGLHTRSQSALEKATKQVPRLEIEG